MNMPILLILDTAFHQLSESLTTDRAAVPFLWAFLVSNEQEAQQVFRTSFSSSESRACDSPYNRASLGMYVSIVVLTL